LSTDLVTCRCGQTHEIARHEHGLPVVECPQVPPGVSYLIWKEPLGKVMMEAPRG
jgi:hypothetical protein